MPISARTNAPIWPRIMNLSLPAASKGGEAEDQGEKMKRGGGAATHRRTAPTTGLEPPKKSGSTTCDIVAALELSAPDTCRMGRGRTPRRNSAAEFRLRRYHDQAVLQKRCRSLVYKLRADVEALKENIRWQTNSPLSASFDPKRNICANCSSCVLRTEPTAGRTPLLLAATMVPNGG